MPCQTAQLVLLSTTSDLTFRLQNSLDGYPIVHVHEFEEFQAQCYQSYGCCGVIDTKQFVLNDPATARRLPRLHQMARSGHEMLLIAASDASLGPESLNLLKLGFHGVIRRSEARKIASSAHKYWNTLNWPLQNVPDSVISNLPWTVIE